jgi:hypothetical protein
MGVVDVTPESFRASIGCSRVLIERGSSSIADIGHPSTHRSIRHELRQTVGFAESIIFMDSSG